MSTSELAIFDPRPSEKPLLNDLNPRKSIFSCWKLPLDRAKRAKIALWAKRIHSCFCFSESSKAIIKKQPPRPSETRSKCHERSECHRAVFHSQTPFYTFKKLLKAFRPPSSPRIPMLSDFKKLQMPCIKLQMPCFILLDYICSLFYKYYKFIICRFTWN